MFSVKTKEVIQLVELIRKKEKIPANTFPIEDVAGHMICPRCDGILHFKIQKLSGRMFLNCETMGCYRVKE